MPEPIRFVAKDGRPVIIRRITEADAALHPKG